jgi:hypothetical protein
MTKEKVVVHGKWWLDRRYFSSPLSPETTHHIEVALSFVIPRRRLACGKLREE